MSQSLYKTFTKKAQEYLEYSWYNRNWLSYLLWPIGQIYKFISILRRLYLQSCKQQKFSACVVVIGNISVGGVGKTPLVIAIANKLLATGFKVGVVSRGYGAAAADFPYQVKVTDKATMVGDEPLLIAMRCDCPVIIDPKRARAVDYLLKKHNVDVILSDDGLQHYALGRNIEIAVINGAHPYGNGFYLPAGPLREGPQRLTKVDFVISNGKLELSNLHADKTFVMQIEASFLCNCLTQEVIEYAKITQPCRAVAAIGNADRFFNTLQEIGINASQHRYPDHYHFKRKDFVQYANQNIIMTAKDYVKCKEFATDNMYYLEVVAKLPRIFWDNLILLLSKN